MADSYDSAQTQINSQKAAMLAAMAQSGSAGKALYDQSQQDLANQRSNAVNAALADAQGRGAPAAMLAQISSQVGAPYDRRASDITTSHGAEDQWLSNLGAANSAYMDQASAAIPTLRAVAQRQQAALAQKAAAAASKSSADRGPLYDLSRSLGGIANANRYLKDQATQFEADAATAASQNHGAMPGTMGGPGSYEPSQAYDAFDKAGGLPTGYTSGLFSNSSRDTYAKKAGMDDAAAAHIRSLPQYDEIIGKANTAISGGNSSKTVRAAILQQYGKSNPNTVRLVLAELGL